MGRKLAKLLSTNMGLKLLALVFAVFMWMAVVNLDDPTINKVFTIAVTIENESAVAAQGKYYEVVEDSGNVTFNVSGKRSIMDKLSVSDFKATADMSKLIQQEGRNVVPVEITALRYASQLTITRRSQEMLVNLEALMKNQYVIQPNAIGEPADGYALGNMEVTPNLLKVSGPKNVVSRISTVKANIDVTDMSSAITDSVVPVLLDESGEVIDTTQLTLNLNTVSVRAQILSEKSVPIKAEYGGEPADGYEVISLSASPKEITIKGTSDVLNSISSITIPEGVITVDDVDKKFDQQVDISKYLPNGVSLSNAAQATVTITVDVEQLERRTFHIPVENIAVDNLPEGYHIEYNKQSVALVIYGLKADLDELVVDNLHPLLDVDGMSAGSHVGQLELMLDGNFIVGDLTVSYTIVTDTPADTQEPQGSGQGEDENDQDAQEPDEEGESAMNLEDEVNE